jgi:serine/threonine protein kinase
MVDQRERIGQTVGDYRLLKWLGGGSFGNVYLAEHLHDHTQVAIKVLAMRLTHPRDWRAFLNEARMFRLRHPHIMPLLDFGLSRQDEPFLVMDYAPNGTLRDRHPKGSRVPLPTVVGYATQVASALQYAHDQRLIHRDVKPENLLLRSDGVVLLSDFGIATAAHSTDSFSTSEGVSGTALYMAPEQWKGKPQPQSDQYALAVVIYEWLTGRCPFVGTALEVMSQHTTQLPPSLLEQVPDLSSEIEEVLFHALAKDPKERFASIRAFINALRQANALPTLSQSIPTPPVEAPPRTSLATRVLSFVAPALPNPMPISVNNWIESPQPNRRRRNLTVALVGGLVALLGGSGAVMAFAKVFASPCSSDQISCNGVCIKSDSSNCGSCGNVCQADKVCVNGTCQCPPGQNDCHGMCIDLKTDAKNCGVCGNTCPTYKVCANGTCQCPSGQNDCHGKCIDLKTDANNCGTCGYDCPSYATCVGGTCKCSYVTCGSMCCQSGFICSGGICSPP